MNYLKTYVNLMRKAQRRDLPPPIYEEHHVFPKSIYGENNYLIKLSPREHYIAHALLYKALIKRYGKNHPKSIKMIYAFKCMHMESSSNIHRYMNSRLFETLRVHHRESLLGENNPMYGISLVGELNPMFGKKHSEETRNKISKKAKERFKKEKSPMYGRSHSLESKQKISLAKKGKSTISPDGRKKISEASKARVFSEETIRKMSAANTGEKNPNFGKVTSKETKNKISKTMSALKWFNDGKKSIRAKECPPGFKPGRGKIPTRKVAHPEPD